MDLKFILSLPAGASRGGAVVAGIMTMIFLLFPVCGTGGVLLCGPFLSQQFIFAGVASQGATEPVLFECAETHALSISTQRVAVAVGRHSACMCQCYLL